MYANDDGWPFKSAACKGKATTEQSNKTHGALREFMNRLGSHEIRRAIDDFDAMPLAISKRIGRRLGDFSALPFISACRGRPYGRQLVSNLSAAARCLTLGGEC